MSKSIPTRIVVRHFPDMKKPCLCIEQGNQALVLARFRNEESVALYNEFMDGSYLQRAEGMRDIFKEVKDD